MKNKGFTLIELLVVIAIIGVLAGILFVAINPTDQINNSKEKAVQAYLAGVPTAATISYDSDGEYNFDDLCADLTLPDTVKYKCGASGNEWVVLGEDPSNTGQSFCKDSTGAGLETVATADEAARTALAATFACN